MERPVLAAMVSCRATQLSDAEKRIFSQSNPLGLTLFSRNIKNRAQLKRLIDDFKNCVGRDDVLIAVDQEGGRVRRLAEPEWPTYAAGITLSRLPAPQAEEAAALHARLIADDLREIGVNWNYAPVLDVAYPQTSPVIYSRTFGADKNTVAKLGKIEIAEYIRGGVCPCIKHLPGHGRAVVDPHLQLPVLTAGWNELQNDFYPFQMNNQTPAGMTAHIVIPVVDDRHPVTQSKTAIDKIIRGAIGFEGLLISDALDMHALKGSTGEKALASITAGCDCVCYAMGKEDELEELAAVCPPLSAQALDRYEKIKNIISNRNKQRCSKEDRARYMSLIGSVPPYKEEYDATAVLERLNHPQSENKEKNKC